MLQEPLTINELWTSNFQKLFILTGPNYFPQLKFPFKSLKLERKLSSHIHLRNSTIERASFYQKRPLFKGGGTLCVFCYVLWTLCFADLHGKGCYVVLGLYFAQPDLKFQIYKKKNYSTWPLKNEP